MKKNFNFINAVIITVLMFFSSTGLHAGTGDFNAWVYKTGHDGAVGGKLTFAEHDLTVEMWLNLDANPGNLSGVIGTVNGSAGFLVEVRTGTAATNNEDNLRFFAKPLTGTNNIDLRIPLSKVLGQWTHVAYVISSTDNKAYLYVNGEPFNAGYTIANFDVAQGGWLGNTVGTTTSRTMDFLKWWSNPKPLGKMADFRVWNIARTAAEIKADFDKNLETTTNPGLIVNYIFTPFERGMLNNAFPADATNKLWLNPATDYQNFHSPEVLSYRPETPILVGTNLTWNTPGALTNNSWVVEFTDKTTGIIVKMDTVNVNSSDISVLANGDYSARVRTKNNLFYSGWTDPFDFSKASTGVLNQFVENLYIVQSGSNSITINIQNAQDIYIHNIDGHLHRIVNAVEGKNTVDGLSKGVYLINKQKIVIR